VNTIQSLLPEANKRLAAAGVEGPLRDARLLLECAAGIGIAQQIGDPGRQLSDAEAASFRALVERRAQREPMAQILGRREFWSLRFKVTGDTLDPRPDSETLVQAVLDRVGDRAAPLRILDFGTGTGCLLLSLLHELPNASGLGVEASPPTYEVALENTRALGLDRRAAMRIGDWEAGIDDVFDIIVSNPPYIPRGDLPALQPEVLRYEPHLALDGGPDGLDAYRRLLPATARLLREGGLAAFEIGIGQADSVAALGVAAGLRHIGTLADLGSVPRVVLWEKAQAHQRIDR
jgi:release factor glutamine methyltransferase